MEWHWGIVESNKEGENNVVVWGKYYLEIREVRVVGTDDEGKRYVLDQVVEGVACATSCIGHQIPAKGFKLRASS